MESIPIDQRTLIQKGEELARAYYVFAPPRMRREFDAQRDANAIESQAASLPQGSEKLEIGEIVQTAAEQFQKFLKVYVEPEIAQIMREHLILAIRRGAFGIYGVPQRPKPAHEYVEIPLAMLEPQFIKWRQSAIQDAHFAFRSVRVLRNPKRRASLASAPLSVPDEKPAARRKRLTIETFEEIRAELPAKYNKITVVKEVTRVLTAKYPEYFPGGRGTDYDTICRHLSGHPGF